MPKKKDNENITELARVLGSKGGRIGGKTKGPVKRRGNSEYYKELARQRWLEQKEK